MKAAVSQSCGAERNQRRSQDREVRFLDPALPIMQHNSIFHSRCHHKVMVSALEGHPRLKIKSHSYFFLGARLKSSGPLISPTSHHTGRQMCFRQLPFFFFLKLLTTTNAVRSLISTDCGGLARATKRAFTGDLLTSMTQANGKGYKKCVTQMDSLDPPCIVVLTVM